MHIKQFIFTILFLFTILLLFQHISLGLDSTLMGLPKGAIARLGKGSISLGDRTMAYSPDGTILAVATEIGVWLYETRAYEATDLLIGHTSPVRSIAFSPDGTLLAIGSGDDTVKLWSVEDRMEIAAFTGHTKGVNALAFSPDGKILVRDKEKLNYPI
jgi:WD40 repeat protein